MARAPDAHLHDASRSGVRGQPAQAVGLGERFSLERDHHVRGLHSRPLGGTALDDLGHEDAFAVRHPEGLRQVGP